MISTEGNFFTTFFLEQSHVLILEPKTSRRLDLAVDHLDLNE